MWVPSYIGIHRNEMADMLTKATSNTISSSPVHLLWTDFIPILRRNTASFWSNYWNKLPANSATKYKTVVPIIQKKLGFTTLIYQVLLFSVLTDFRWAILFFQFTHTNLA